MVVAGLRDDGRRKVLAEKEAGTESKPTYRALFKRLKEGGLQGFEFVTSDDHRGVTAAIDRHFQGAN